MTLGAPLTEQADASIERGANLSGLEYPDVGEYRYVVKGDSIAVVDPDDYRIVDVIR